MRWIALTVLTLVCLTACGITAEDPPLGGRADEGVRVACGAWAEIKDSVEAQEPQVALAAEALERAAEASDIPKLADLARKLNDEVSRWLATDAEDKRPFGRQLTKAIDEFEQYCAEKGAPV
jgi:hypothetical protein